MKQILNLILVSVCVLFFYEQHLFAQDGSPRPPSGKGPRAGAYLDFSGYYSISEATSEPSNTYQSVTDESIYDAKLGYIFANGVYTGAMYSSRTTGYINGSSTGNGAGVGGGYYFLNGFALRGFYRFNEVYVDYRNGTGYQFEASYSQIFATNFFVGFAVSYRQTVYTKRDSDPLLTNYSYKSSYPLLTVGFLVK